MKPEPITQAVRDPPNANFRSGIPTANGAHIVASLLTRQPIRHSPNFFLSQSNTARCSSSLARLICDRSQSPVGFSVVMFFAP